MGAFYSAVTGRQVGKLEAGFSQGALEILTYWAHTIMEFQVYHRPVHLTAVNWKPSILNPISFIRIHTKLASKINSLWCEMQKKNRNKFLHGSKAWFWRKQQRCLDLNKLKFRTLPVLPFWPHEKDNKSKYLLIQQHKCVKYPKTFPPKKTKNQSK